MKRITEDQKIAKTIWKGILMIVLVTGFIALGLSTGEKPQLVPEEGEMFAPTILKSGENFNIHLESGKFVYGLESNKASELNNMFSKLYNGEEHLLILVFNKQFPSDDDQGKLLEQLREKAEKDEKQGIQILVVYDGNEMWIIDSGKYTNRGFLRSIMDKFTKKIRAEGIVFENYADYLPAYFDIFIKELPTLKMKLKFVGNDKFASKELTQKRKEFVKKIQLDGVDAHQKELTRLFVHIEYDIYAYNEKSPYYRSFAQFERVWDQKLTEIKMAYSTKKGKENFYLLKDVIYEKLGIYSIDKPYDKDRASFLYAFVLDPSVQCSADTRLIVAVAQGVLGSELQNLVVIATKGHLLPGYLDSNGDLHGIEMMVKRRGEVAFGNINDGSIKTEMIVYDAEKFVLAESLYSDYDITEIHEKAKIFDNRKTTAGSRKPARKGRFFNRQGTCIDSYDCLHDPSQGSNSKFERPSLFGFGTAEVPSGRLPMVEADTVDPSTYSNMDTVRRISRGEGVRSGTPSATGVTTAGMRGFDSRILDNPLDKALKELNREYGNIPGQPPGFVYTGYKAIRHPGETESTIVLYWQNKEVKQEVYDGGQLLGANVLTKFDSYTVDPAAGETELRFLSSRFGMNAELREMEFESVEYESLTKEQAEIEKKGEDFKDYLKEYYSLQHSKTEGEIKDFTYNGYDKYADGYKVYYEYTGKYASDLKTKWKLFLMKADIYYGVKNPKYSGTQFSYYSQRYLPGAKPKPDFVK